jgi:hypothetical protein
VFSVSAADKAGVAGRFGLPSCMVAVFSFEPVVRRSSKEAFAADFGFGASCTVTCIALMKQSRIPEVYGRFRKLLVETRNVERQHRLLESGIRADTRDRGSITFFGNQIAFPISQKRSGDKSDTQALIKNALIWDYPKLQSTMGRTGAR